MSSGRRRLRSTFLALLSCGLVLGVAACGDDDDDDGGTGGFGPPQTEGLPTREALLTALEGAQDDFTGPDANGGLNTEMWATLVDRSGIVVAVVFSGPGVGDQWLLSRAISAQKANTANGLSLNGLALSTANLYSATQPGGSLFGLQESNPVDPSIAYTGEVSTFGTTNDPMIGSRVGGVNVFGGGVALYNSGGQKIGAIGVSGDTSCADHNIAWKMRDALGLDYVPGGVAEGGATDNIIYDIDGTGASASGFGHPECSGVSTTTAQAFPSTHPVSVVAP